MTLTLPWKKREQEASAASEEARCKLEQEKAKWPEVRKKTLAIKGLREENHFVDTFNTLLKGG